jgi:hypothetical protein
MYVYNHRNLRNYDKDVGAGPADIFGERTPCKKYPP